MEQQKFCLDLLLWFGRRKHAVALLVGSGDLSVFGVMLCWSFVVGELG